jgi:hypothetical protein
MCDYCFPFRKIISHWVTYTQYPLCFDLYVFRVHIIFVKLLILWITMFNLSIMEKKTLEKKKIILAVKDLITSLWILWIIF